MASSGERQQIDTQVLPFRPAEKGPTKIPVHSGLDEETREKKDFFRLVAREDKVLFRLSNSGACEILIDGELYESVHHYLACGFLVHAAEFRKRRFPGSSNATYQAMVSKEMIVRGAGSGDAALYEARKAIRADPAVRQWYSDFLLTWNPKYTSEEDYEALEEQSLPFQILLRGMEAKFYGEGTDSETCREILLETGDKPIAEMELRIHEFTGSDNITIRRDFAGELLLKFRAELRRAGYRANLDSKGRERFRRTPFEKMKTKDLDERIRAEREIAKAIAWRLSAGHGGQACKAERELDHSTENSDMRAQTALEGSQPGWPWIIKPYVHRPRIANPYRADE